MHHTCRKTSFNTKFMIKEHPFLPEGHPVLFFNSTSCFSHMNFSKSGDIIDLTDVQTLNLPVL